MSKNNLDRHEELNVQSRYSSGEANCNIKVDGEAVGGVTSG